MELEEINEMIQLASKEEAETTPNEGKQNVSDTNGTGSLSNGTTTKPIPSAEERGAIEEVSTTDEEFLINSIINEITRVIRNDINELGKAIIIRECMINDVTEKELTETTGFLVTSLEEMKSPKRIIEAEETITDWEKVLLNNFSLSQRSVLRQEHLIKAD